MRFVLTGDHSRHLDLRHNIESSTDDCEGRDRDKERHLLRVNLAEDWMGKAYSVAWFVGVFVPLIVMIGLYSRVVFALWFKGNDGNQLSQQQKVSLILSGEFNYQLFPQIAS